MIIDNAPHYREQVIALLAAQKLPVTDLSHSLDHFLVAIADGCVIGVAGMEIYGSYGLLRSLAVAPDHRNAGIAGKLINNIEALGRLNDLKILYLLTETAAEYFKRKGFSPIKRTDVPSAIQASSEFRHVCPVSAIVMKKSLTPIT